MCAQACPVHVHMCGTCVFFSVYVWMNVSWHAHVHAKMNATRVAQYQQCVTDVNHSRPHIRSFHGNSMNTTQTQQQQDVDGSATTAAPDTPTIKVRVAEDGVKLRSCAGRFSPIVSAPAGSKLPGYNRKPPAGGRRQAAPLLAGTTVNIVGRGVDKTGAPWFRVETDDGVSGWLAQGSVDVRTTN